MNSIESHRNGSDSLGEKSIKIKEKETHLKPWKFQLLEVRER